MADEEPVRIDALVDAELDQREIAHLDFTVPTLCRVRVVYVDTDTEKIVRADERCGKKATWTAACRHCGALTWLCTDCKVASILRESATCNQCKTIEPAHVMFSYEPLAGVS